MGDPDTGDGGKAVKQALALVARIRKTGQSCLAVGPEAETVVPLLRSLIPDGDDSPDSDDREDLDDSRPQDWVRLSAHYALGYLHWYRYLDSGRQDQRAMEIARSSLACCMRHGHRDDFPAGLQADLADVVEPYACRALAAAGQSTTRAVTDRAIQLWSRVVQATPDDEPAKGVRQSKWGAALLHHFEATREPSFLDEAVRVCETAAGRNWGYDAQYAQILIQAAKARTRRSEERQREAGEDRDQALKHYQQVIRLDAVPPSAKAEASQSAAALIADSDPEQAARLWEEAVKALPLVASHHLTPAERQSEVGAFAGLARAAAAARLRLPGADNAGMALRLLELGRGILVGPRFSARTDLYRLGLAHPDLARCFTDLRNHLDKVPSMAGKTDSELQQYSDQRKEWAVQLDHTLEEIRRKDGFASFGLPPSLPELLDQAKSGPVVVLTTSGDRCDALVLTEQGVTAVPIAGVDEVALRKQATSFRDALAALAGRNSSTPPLRLLRHQSELNLVLEWLWDNIAEPVLDLVAPAGCAQDAEPPRVWWVCCGPFSLLPMHAAGYFRSEIPDPRALADRVVSSYTPTILALRHARQQARERPATAPPGRSLIVSMPRTPGCHELIAVTEEAARLREVLPNPSVLTSRNSDTIAGGQTPADQSLLPTRESVLTLLSEVSIAHFACHGHSDPQDPSESRLLLHGDGEHPLTVGSIMQKIDSRAELAYLSACSTAATEPGDLDDEAIHLVSAFQLVGFPRVIGTLWEIEDDVAARVASAFYDGLRDEGSGLRFPRAARALQYAAGKERHRRPANPYEWAPYVHVGA